MRGIFQQLFWCAMSQATVTTTSTSTSVMSTQGGRRLTLAWDSFWWSNQGGNHSGRFPHHHHSRRTGNHRDNEGQNCVILSHCIVGWPALESWACIRWCTDQAHANFKLKTRLGRNLGAKRQRDMVMIHDTVFCAFLWLPCYCMF